MQIKLLRAHIRYLTELLSAAGIEVLDPPSVAGRPIIDPPEGDDEGSA